MTDPDQIKSWSMADTEFIIKVDEQDFEVQGGWGSYEGFVVTTNKRRVKMGVSKGKSCCEVTGYFTSEDDPKSFIGKQLVGVEVVDTMLNKKQIDRIEYLDQGGVMFVNLNCTDGTLQFVVYNVHNGYYGHEAMVAVGALSSGSELPDDSTYSDGI